MQATIESPKNQPVTRTFDASEAMVVREDIDLISVVDAIDEKLSHLAALLMMARRDLCSDRKHGRVSDEYLEDTLSAASSFVKTIKQFSERLN